MKSIALVVLFFIFYLTALTGRLVPFENISCVNLVLHIIQATIIAVRNDSLALLLELVKVSKRPNLGPKSLHPQ